MNKLSEEEKDEIIEHMNSDHPDAVLLYLRHYASLPLSDSGVIEDVDETKIKVMATIQDNDNGGLKTMRVVIPLIRRVESIKEADNLIIPQGLSGLLLRAAEIASGTNGT